MKLIPKLFGLALSNLFGKQLLKESIDIVTPDGQIIPSNYQQPTQISPTDSCLSFTY